MADNEQLLVFVDADVKKQLKIYAATQGVTLKTVVDEALRSFLGVAKNLGNTIPQFNHECKKCGRGWSADKSDPRVCPYCKSYAWRESPTDRLTHGGRQLFQHECEPCSNKWENGIAEPKACPSCGSKAWKAGSPLNMQAKFSRALKLSSRDALTLSRYSGIEGIADYNAGRKPVTQELLDQLNAGIERCLAAEAKQQEKEEAAMPATIPWGLPDEEDTLW